MTETQSPSPTSPPTLETIPLEVLEHIAFSVATTEIGRPPTNLASLCRASKAIHGSLSLSGNPSLYAAIFRFMFDVAAPIRRLGPDHTTAQCLASELRKRYEGMKRIRAGIGSRTSEATNRQHDLWMAIFMMLENDGKNVKMLKQFALVDEWLLEYFLDHPGGSYAWNDIYSRCWPMDNHDNRLAMWLLWLCDADGTSMNYPSETRRMYCEVLRVYAFGATRYPLTPHSWDDFSHPCTISPTEGAVYLHYNIRLTLTAPPISIAAILAYISRIKEDERSLSPVTPDTTFGVNVPTSRCNSKPADGQLSLKVSFSQGWDFDWARCVGSGLHNEYIIGLNGLQRTHHAGVLEGAWEGVFTYMEFTAYASILAGGPPQTMHDGAIGQSIQVWKLREYNLYTDPNNSSDQPLAMLPLGEALTAFFPPTIVEERDDHVVFTHALKKIIYSRALRPQSDDKAKAKTLCDVVVLGEGHSSWGKFRLRGRVRGSDALITILKEYDGIHARGRWLYRGYLVGGRLAGRWRDTLTPLDMEGYEGSFELALRA